MDKPILIDAADTFLLVGIVLCSFEHLVGGGILIAISAFMAIARSRSK